MTTARPREELARRLPPHAYHTVIDQRRTSDDDDFRTVRPLSPVGLGWLAFSAGLATRACSWAVFDVSRAVALSALFLGPLWAAFSW